MPDKKYFIALGIAILILILSIVFFANDEEPAIPEEIRQEMEQ